MKLKLAHAALLLSFFVCTYCNDKVEYKLRKPIHYKWPQKFSLPNTTEELEKSFRRVVSGDIKLSTLFNTIPFWRSLEKQLKYDKFQPFDADFSYNILDYFYEFLEYVGCNWINIKPKRIFEGMSDSQLEALFYGAQGISPICSHDLMSYKATRPLFNYFIERVKVDLDFTCYSEDYSTVIQTYVMLNGYRFLSPASPFKRHMSPSAFDTLMGVLNVRGHDEERKRSLLKYGKGLQNLIRDNVLFYGGVIQKKDLENYFETEKRTCYATDRNGDTGFHVSLLHSNLDNSLYFLNSIACERILDHYNHEGNNPLMYLLEHLPFTNIPGPKSKISPNAYDLSHSIAHVLIKKMLEKQKMNLSIRNIQGNNSYLLAAKTNSLTILHMLWTYSSPNASEENEILEFAINNGKFYIIIYIIIFHRNGTITKEIQSEIERAALKLKADDNSYNVLDKAIVDLVSDKPSLEKTRAMIINTLDLSSEEKTKLSATQQMVMAAAAAIKDNDLRRLELILLLTQKSGELLTLKSEYEDAFQAKDVIKQCANLRRKTMHWLLVEFGFHRADSEHINVLHKWKMYDYDDYRIIQPIISSRGEVDNEMTKKFIDSYLENWISPQKIYDDLFAPIIIKGGYSRVDVKGAVDRLIAAGLSPNALINRKMSAFVSKAIDKQDCSLYIEAGANINYATSYQGNVYRSPASAIMQSMTDERLESMLTSLQEKAQESQRKSLDQLYASIEKFSERERTPRESIGFYLRLGLTKQDLFDLKE